MQPLIAPGFHHRRPKFCMRSTPTSVRRERKLTLEAQRRKRKEEKLISGW